MTTTTNESRATAHGPRTPAPNPDKAIALALRLANAEHALRSLTMGQVDAILDIDGRTFLLRPAQEQLRRSEARLQALLDSTADVITVVDRGGEIVSESRSTIRTFGYTPEEVVGSSLFKRVHEEDMPRLHAAFFNVVEGFREAATVEFRLQTKEGHYREMEATLAKLRDLSVNAVVMACRDATGRREVQQETALREAAMTGASQAKDRFLAMLGHELRTPLTPVLLGLSELEEDERFRDAAPMLAMIRRNIELQSRLLEELSDFTAVGHYKVRLQEETVDAHEAVQFVLEICKSEIAAARIDVRLHFRAENRMVQADSVRLQQVMWNLVKNAVKFSTPGSSIAISSANETPGNLTLEFRDYGIGIEAGLLPLVFDPFQQGEHTTQPHYGGLGLGMFIARGLTEAQGGTLTVASKGLCHGSTFRMTLKTASVTNEKPVHAPTVALFDGPWSRTPELTAKPLCILLVENGNDPAIGDYLEERGHSVFAAPDMQTGLAISEKFRLDLLITDLALSDGRGLDLLEQLRVKRPSLQGIALCGQEPASWTVTS